MRKQDKMKILNKYDKFKFNEFAKLIEKITIDRKSKNFQIPSINYKLFLENR